MKTYRKKTKNFSVVHKASVRNQRKYQEFSQKFSQKFIFLLKCKQQLDFDFHTIFTRLFVKDN